MREEKISFTNSRGDTLSGVLHHAEKHPARGAVILCHGMESDKNSEKLVFLSRELARRGVLALRFDFSYVGESSGKFEDITYSGEVEDLKAAYALLRSRHAGKTAILGSSMGGTVALMFAAREPTKLPYCQTIAQTTKAPVMKPRPTPDANRRTVRVFTFTARTPPSYPV